MAIVTYPLNGIDFSAEDAETYLCTRTSGVFSADGNFKASVTGDRQVTISPGLAWIKNSEFSGKSVCNTEPVPVEIPLADGTRPRIDRIVLRFDKARNESRIVLKQGVPSSAPTASSVERTELIYELGLCTVYVKASSTVVDNGDITSTLLDESVCGLMRDGVTGIPTAQLQQQVYNLIDELREVIAGIESGSQTMLKAVYDPQGKNKDVFEEITNATSNTYTIKVPASGWKDGALTFQGTACTKKNVVAVAGVTADTKLSLGRYVSGDLNACRSYLCQDTGAGKVTFWATSALAEFTVELVEVK